MNNDFNVRHKGLVTSYIIRKFKYSLSFENRVSMDLGYTNYTLNFSSKELEAISDEELENRIKALKKPWWYDLYEKYLEYNTRRLLICFTILNMKQDGIKQAIKVIRKIIRCKKFENKKRFVLPPEYLEKFKEKQ